MSYSAQQESRTTFALNGLVRLGSLLIVCSVVFPLHAGQLPGQNKPDVKVDVGTNGDAALFLEDRARQALAAAAVVGGGSSIAGEPPGAWGLLNPQHGGIWPTKEEAAPLEMIRDKAPTLLPDMLAGIRDGRPIPHAWADQPKPADTIWATEEHRAYAYYLYQANRTTQEAFAKSARHDLTYIHLWNEPR